MKTTYSIPSVRTRPVLGVLGMPGSGKSVLAAYLKEAGLSALRLGQFVEDEVIRRGLPHTSNSETIVREDLRREEGNDVLARRALQHIRNDAADEMFVLDGVYSPDEDQVLRDGFGAAYFTIAVVCNRKTRYGRLAIRDHRELTSEEARDRDLHEIEFLRKADTIVLADYFILNNYSVSAFLRSSLLTIARHLEAQGLMEGALQIADCDGSELIARCKSPSTFPGALLWLAQARALLERDPILTWQVADLGLALKSRVSLSFLLGIGMRDDITLGSSSLHRIAARGLAELGVDGRELLPFLNSSSEGSRSFAADALGELLYRPGAGHLFDLLKYDESDEAALWAALSLAKIASAYSDQSIPPRLEEIVASGSRDRRCYAFDALAKISRQRASDLLGKLDATRLGRDAIEELRALLK